MGRESAMLEPEDTAKFVFVNCQIFANYWNLNHYIKNMQESKVIATLILVKALRINED